MAFYQFKPETNDVLITVGPGESFTPDDQDKRLVLLVNLMKQKVTEFRKEFYDPTLQEVQELIAKKNNPPPPEETTKKDLPKKSKNKPANIKKINKK